MWLIGSDFVYQQNLVAPAEPQRHMDDQPVGESAMAKKHECGRAECAVGRVNLFLKRIRERLLSIYGVSDLNLIGIMRFIFVFFLY